LSAAIRLGDLSLSTRSKRRFARKLGALERGVALGQLGEAEAALRAERLVAFTRHAAALGLRQAVLRGRQEEEEAGRRAASRARTGQPLQVVRGGSWNNNAINARVANRNNNNPSNRNNNIGFRLALSSGDSAGERNRTGACARVKPEPQGWGESRERMPPC